MTDYRADPPEVGGGSTPEAANTTTNHRQASARCRLRESDTRPWQRRRLASYRLPPLDCGCRDPWPCRCTEPPLSQRDLDCWRAAALHVLDTGPMPVLPPEVCAALWRRGGPDRAVGELVCGQVAA